MAEERETIYCDICARNGIISKINVYQINFDEATKICENENCTYPLGLNKSSSNIISRRYTDMTCLTKKKEPVATPPQPKSGPRKVIHRPVKLQTIKSTLPTKTLSPYVPGKPLLEKKTVNFLTPKSNLEKNKILSSSEDGKVATVEKSSTSSRQNSIAHVLNEDRFAYLQLSNKEIFPQWQNKDALCWLDVVMCLFVHNKCFHRSLKEQDIGPSVVVTLVKAYEQAVSLINSPRSSSSTDVLGQKQTVTSNGQTPVEAMDTDIGSPSGKISVCKEVVGDFKRLSVDEDSVKTGAGFQLINSDFLSVVATHGESAYSRAFEILQNVRESTWKAIQPRLRCKKGQNDSPVFAVPLLIKDNKNVEKLFTMSYSFTLKCSHCGHVKTDHYEKVLPTFPNTSKDFNMSAPAFVRPCFQCETPNQKRVMIYERLSDVVMLHFVEGLPHNNFEKLSFRYNGNLYAVTGLIQYRNDPDHFVAWLRDPVENLWMECDDLKSPVTCFSSPVPDLPASQIHIVMWEIQTTTSGHNLTASLTEHNCINPLEIYENKNMETIEKESNKSKINVSMEETVQHNAGVENRNPQVTAKPEGGIFMVKISPSGHLVPVPPQDAGGTMSVCPITILPQSCKYGSLPQPNNLIQNLKLVPNVSYRCIPLQGQAGTGKSEILVPLVNSLNVTKGPSFNPGQFQNKSRIKTASSASIQENFISKTKSNVSFLRTIKEKRSKHPRAPHDTNTCKSGDAAVMERNETNSKRDSTQGHLKSSASEGSFLSRFSHSTPQVSNNSAFNLKGKIFAGYKSRSVDECTSRASSPVSEISSRCSSPALSTSSDGVVVQKRKTEVFSKVVETKRRKSVVSENICSDLEVENEPQKSQGNLDSAMNSECEILQGLYSALNIPLPEKPGSGEDLGFNNEIDLPDALELANYVENDENSSQDFENFLSQL